jgi:hypothetical protein
MGIISAAIYGPLGKVSTSLISVAGLGNKSEGGQMREMSVDWEVC